MATPTTSPGRIDPAYAARARRVAWSGKTRRTLAEQIGVGDACRVERATDAAAGVAPAADHAAHAALDDEPEGD